MRRKSLFFVFLLIILKTTAQQIHPPYKEDNQKTNYKQGKLLLKDDFVNLNNWVIEKPKSPASKVFVKDKKLVIDVDGGATVWFKKKLSGDILITYRRKVVVGTGKNDRLSDFNQFWMASDPKNENLFNRSGVFSEYDSLSLYYVGFGGNTNSTTRFRKYLGNGEKPLIKEYLDKEHLLEANKNYSVKTVIYKEATTFYIDEKVLFSYKDLAPLTEGYFGFRTTESRHEISDFKIYQLK